MASLGFRSAEGALSTIEGYEAMHLIRKGQIRWLPKGDVVGQRRFIHILFGIAASFKLTTPPLPRTAAAICNTSAESTA